MQKNGVSVAHGGTRIRPYGHQMSSYQRIDVVASTCRSRMADMTNPELLSKTLSLAVHELRTPLSVCMGYIRMVLGEQAGPLNDKQKKLLTEAQQSCGRLSALVDDLSLISKLDGQKLPFAEAPLDVASLMAELAGDMHEGADRGVRIEVTSDGHPLPVLGDRTRLVTALGALMRAALRERGGAGVVTVDASRRDWNGTRWAVVAIGDAPLIPALRDPGDTPPAFDEWIGGMGFALPMARRVIEAHGGALWSAADATSRAASGLRLPLRT